MPSSATKPEAVPQQLPHPLPQATIKLQAAPAPASAARKTAEVPAGSSTSEKKVKAPSSESPEISDEESRENAVDDIPLPIAIAAAVLALLAVGVQVWTWIS
ncbi:MAG: hypothetical protein WCP60_02345 [bacterium]